MTQFDQNQLQGQTDQQFMAIRPFIIENFQQYRILQPRMVFLHGLPQILSVQQVLSKQLSGYGSIRKISTQFIHRNFHSAFVEFDTEIAASLSIASLDNFYIEKRSLRVSYASTKFCPNYLKLLPCHLPDCNYAHYYVAQMAHLKEFSKQLNHQAIAINNLWQKYQEVLLFLCRFSEESQPNLFPSPSVKVKQLFLQKGQQFYEQEQQILYCLKLIESKEGMYKSVVKELINTRKKLQESRSKSSSSKNEQKLSESRQSSTYQPRNRLMHSYSASVIVEPTTKHQQQKEWLDLEDSMSQFLFQSERPPKSCKSIHSSHSYSKKSHHLLLQTGQNGQNTNKTPIQEFLDQAEENLMQLIFTSSTSMVVF